MWQHVGDGTLEEKLIECDRRGTLLPLAQTIGLDGYVEGDVKSLSRLVNRLAEELLNCCSALENSGIGECPFTSRLICPMCEHA